MTEDLWGGIPPVEKDDPSLILEAQATFLDKRTKGVLEGEVRRSFDGIRATLTLSIVAPYLDNYRLPILIMAYDLLNNYPINAFNELTSERIEWHNEDEFLDGLKSILQSDVTLKIVRNLLVHSGRREELGGIF